MLRPLTNFEDYYQGVDAVTTLAGSSVPIPFFSNAKTRDAAFDGRDPSAVAGTEGFDPDLLDFTPVPMGCLCKVWIPFFTDPQDVANTQAYRYMFNWRVSDIVRYTRDLGGQYHLPTESFGAPDTIAGPPLPRFVTPAATRNIIVNQAETTDPFGPQSNNVRREYLTLRGGQQPAQPLIRAPNGLVTRQGVYQQGIIDPNVSPGFARTPVFQEFEIITGGDRLLVTVDRFGENGETSGPSLWDFSLGGLDVGFSVFYGTGKNTNGEFLHVPYQDVGIYLFFGSAP